MPTVMIKILFTFLCSSLLFASADSYTLKLKIDKKELYLGESAYLSLLFSYDDTVEDYELPEIKIPNFQVEELSSSDYELKNGLFAEQIEYKLTPLQSGGFTIDAFQAKVETLTKEYKQLNNRSKFTKKLLIASNKLTIHVKQLPENLSVIGHYTLTADVDKQRVHKGERIMLTVTLQGRGNLSDLDALQLDIQNATSYLVMSSKNSKEHLYTKTFEIIGDKSYTIASFSLEYFDKDLGIKRVTQTQPITIEIIDSKIDNISPYDSKTEQQNFLFFLLGALFMLLFIFLVISYKKIKTDKKKTPLLKTIKQSKNSNSLYKKMVVHLGKDKELDKLILSLETQKESKNTKEFQRIKRAILKRILLNGHFFSNYTFFEV